MYVEEENSEPYYESIVKELEDAYVKVGQSILQG
jgi:hypothetical protein